MSKLNPQMRFLGWLFDLSLPGTPIFESPEKKLRFAGEWQEGMKNVTEAEFDVLKSYLRVTLKRFPSMAQVMETFSSIKIPSAHSEIKAGMQIHKWQGQDIFPGAQLVTAEQKKAMIKEFGERGAELPRVDLETGDLTIGGRPVGNMKEYQIEPRITKIKERRSKS